MPRLASVCALTVGCLSLSAMWGCGSDEPSSTGTVPEQLEALDVAASISQAGQVVAAGTLTISGSEREYALTVESAEGDRVDIELHSPALSPLATLHDKTVEIELGPTEMGGRSLAISDEAGPAYVATAGDGAGIDLAEKVLGEGFATWGAEVGTETDGTFVWTYKKAVLAGDAGPVEVLPGEVTTLEVDGATWRVVVIASYTVDTNPDADELPACSPEDMLGFEALRVQAAAEEAPVRRLANAQVAYMGCTAPGGEE